LNSQNLSFFEQPSRDKPRVTKEYDMRNYSHNTIQMLHDSNLYPSDNQVDMDLLNMTNYSTIMNQEQDPDKLRHFYKQFCNAVKHNKVTNSQRVDEINLLDLLMDMRFIGAEGKNQRAQATAMIKTQRHKFYVPIKGDFGRIEASNDDVIKNLFKILCGVNNMRLQQRGMNPIDDKILNTYLDAINNDILDDDIILLN